MSIDLTRSMRLGGAVALCWAFGSTLVMPSSGAERLRADVGLATQVSGKVTYTSQPRAKPVEVIQWMKVREGDWFTLAQDSSMRLVYFDSGRQETWTGPARFQAGKTGGEAATKVKPQVQEMPGMASEGLKRVPVLLRRAGVERLRSPRTEESAQGARSRGVPLTPEEEAEIEAARGAYRQMRSQFVPDDVTPELFLLGVLSDYEQYAEMATILRDLRKKQPQDGILKELEAWVAARVRGAGGDKGE